MHVLISESRLLTALHDVGLTGDLFSLGHTFHVADIFLGQRIIDQSTLNTALAHGLSVEEMSPSEMKKLMELRRAHPSLCVGNAASLTLSVVRGYPILVGNTGLATLGHDNGRSLLDICWIMDQLQSTVSPDRMLQCFEAIIEKERSHFHSPEVATRLQTYEGVLATVRI